MSLINVFDILFKFVHKYLCNIIIVMFFYKSNWFLSIECVIKTLYMVTTSAGGAFLIPFRVALVRFWLACWQLWCKGFQIFLEVFYQYVQRFFLLDLMLVWSPIWNTHHPHFQDWWSLSLLLETWEAECKRNHKWHMLHVVKVQTQNWMEPQITSLSLKFC